MMSSLFGVLLTISMIIQAVNCMIGGEQALAGSFPYVATIRYEGTNRCNGAILNETHILTLGSCVFLLSPNMITVIVGAIHPRDMNAHQVGVQAIHIHPEFLDGCVYTEKNIAVLRLSTPLVWDETIQKVIVGHNRIVFAFRPGCAAIGWGPMCRRKELQSKMRIPLRILNFQNCLSAQLSPARDQICVHDENDSAVLAMNDLGSPIICCGEMVGLLRDINGAAGRPFLIQLLAPHLRFIVGTMESDL